LPRAASTYKAVNLLACWKCVVTRVQINQGDSVFKPVDIWCWNSRHVALHCGVIVQNDAHSCDFILSSYRWWHCSKAQVNTIMGWLFALTEDATGSYDCNALSKSVESIDSCWKTAWNQTKNRKKTSIAVSLVLFIQHLNCLPMTSRVKSFLDFPATFVASHQ